MRGLRSTCRCCPSWVTSLCSSEGEQSDALLSQDSKKGLSSSAKRILDIEQKSNFESCAGSLYRELASAVELGESTNCRSDVSSGAAIAADGGATAPQSPTLPAPTLPPPASKPLASRVCRNSLRVPQSLAVKEAKSSVGKASGADRPVALDHVAESEEAALDARSADSRDMQTVMSEEDALDNGHAPRHSIAGVLPAFSRRSDGQIIANNGYVRGREGILG